MNFELPYPELSQELKGNTGTDGVWLFDSDKPGQTLMITALIHGNELCGAWALKALLEAHYKPSHGRLIVAFANIQAYKQFDVAHYDKSRFFDEDLNRVWIASRLDNPSTYERQRANELLPWVKQADYLLDLHSMHEPSAPLLLTGLLARNIELAKQLAAPVHIISDAGHKDGKRLRDFAQFGESTADAACALLLECGFHGDLRSIDVAKDMIARMLLASGLSKSLGSLQSWLLKETFESKLLAVTDAIVAPSMDVSFAQNWQGLETLANQGELLAWTDGQAIRTPYDNCTIIMPSLKQLLPGVTVMRLARDYEVSL